MMDTSKSRAPLAVGLVHWPVLDRAGNVVCTNVTNFDIHDIARVARSYGVDRYYIISRTQEQLMFVSRILEHWRIGTGAKYNPMRKTALGMIQLKETVEGALADWEGVCQRSGLTVATTARKIEGLERMSFKNLREKLISEPQEPVFLLFGTGFGLHEDVFRLCQATLEPIMGAAPDEYRHLSVRSAVSICLDRLLGSW